MKEEIKYKVGDRVYAPFHGYGVVTEIKDDGREYPITVTWDEKKHGCSASIFTPDGSAFKGLNSEDDDLTLAEKAPPKKDETEGKFKVGDRIQSRGFGVGVVDEVLGSEYPYPITVKWTDDGTYSSFTLGGHYYPRRSDAERDITLLEREEKEMEECINFKAGDRVSYPYHGLGTVIANHDDGRLYPIDVKWDKSPKGYEVSTFTKDGFLVVSLGDCGDNDKLTVVESAMPKDAEEDERMKTKFKVGDRVYFNSKGYGTITKLTQSKTEQYPIVVKWDDTNITSTFTKDGYAWSCDTANDPKLSVVNKANRLAKDLSPEDRGADEMGQITGVIHHNDDGVADRMMYALAKRQDDAINPSHYKVKGIPEAIEIMEHLMTKEQMEGFLWGNIIKYSYRYGRKGDKEETAGKIAWYAKELKELGECESK